MMSTSIVRRARPGSARCPSTLAVLAAATALVAAACSSGSAGTAASQTSGSVPAAAAAPLKAYVGLFQDNAVAVLDTGTDHVIKTIPIASGPHGMVITPDGRTVYVSSDGASTVSVIDTTTDAVRGSIEVGKAPHGLALTPDAKTILVAGYTTTASALAWIWYVLSEQSDAREQLEEECRSAGSHAPGVDALPRLPPRSAGFPSPARK